MTYMSLIFLLRHTYFFLVQHSVFQRPRDDEEHLNWDQESLGQVTLPPYAFVARLCRQQ